MMNAQNDVLQPTLGLDYPFGAESCEHEVELLKEKYKEYFYNQSRFNMEALSTNTYLIVGRRGSGKTSLGKFFNFQTEIPNSLCVDVDEPEIYNEVLQKVLTNQSYSTDISIPRAVKIWEYILWTLIFDAYRDKDAAIAAACWITGSWKSASYLISTLLKQFIMKFLEDKGDTLDKVESQLTSATFRKAQEKVLEFSRTNPVIVSIDTLERYDKNDEVLMGTIAGLIQCASEFNTKHARYGIHVKAFISDEIFPHLKETVIPNTTKFIREPVYLYWRPKDLIRLISWRFYRYLDQSGKLDLLPSKRIAWENFTDVLEKMWYPFFGRYVTNRKGLREGSFPYILRHTQMRPRQLVVLCNQIAKEAIRSDNFPYFGKINIAEIIREEEVELANEVLNSYSRIYPRVAEIIDALRTFPMMFPGSMLDKVAPSTAFAWPAREYSPDAFRRLVAELGIVGRVRSRDDNSRMVSSDFEYTLSDRLALRSNDMCVIHPMFYEKLQIDREEGLIVYPFPDHPDFEGVTN